MNVIEMTLKCTQRISEPLFIAYINVDFSCLLVPDTTCLDCYHVNISKEKCYVWTWISQLTHVKVMKNIDQIVIFIVCIFYMHPLIYSVSRYTIDEEEYMKMRRHLILLIWHHQQGNFLHYQYRFILKH